MGGRTYVVIWTGYRVAGRGSRAREGQARLPPGPEPAPQRPYVRDPPASEQERHPGARGLVGSGAVEDDLAVPGDLVVSSLEVLAGQAQGARDGARIGREGQGAAQGHDP